VVFILLFTLSIPQSFAEIQKFANPCDQGICFSWWPKLPRVAGWHQDQDQSYNYKINAQAPDGRTFANAETVIYANAIYKPRVPESKTLQDLITPTAFSKGPSGNSRGRSNTYR